MATTADLRLVTATRPVYSEHGLVTPRQIICAEPSPDVAKAVSAALDASLSANAAVKAANSPAEGSGSAAAALSSSRAEALAQMTRRLATIQLLRDGLYRACEAYANGAISDTTYAVLLSRYDKAMITMLLGELAAGNFGESLATLGTTAKGTADAAQGSADALDKLLAADKDLLAKQKADDDAKAAAAAAPTDQDKQTALTNADAALKTAQDTENTAETEARKAAAASASTSSEASTAVNQAVGSIAHTADGSAAGVLGTMQRKYIENINADPIIVACISALDRRPQFVRDHWEPPTALATFCNDKFLPVLTDQMKILTTILDEKAAREAAATAFQKEVGDITAVMQKTAPLRDEVHKEEKQPPTVP